MIRRKSIASDDGGGFHGSSRPPASELTARFNELFAEYDDLRSKHGHAKSELRALDNEWVGHADVARRQDGRATAESGRSGAGVVVTTATDALRDRRQRLVDSADAYAAALDIVEQDLADEREHMKETLNARLAAEQKIRLKLHKALDDANAAARALTGAIATREWLTDHLPWESDPLLAITDLWSVSLRVNSKADQKEPVRLDSIIDALKGL